MNIDFHSHILPGADHGSDSLSTTLIQLEAARRANADTVVATPHFYPHIEALDTFLETRSSTAATLKAALSPEMPRVLVGAEVYISTSLPDNPSVAALCVEGTRIILIEMPIAPWGEELYECLERIETELELIPVIAHVDRYKKKQVRRLLDMSLRVQLNADAFCSGRIPREYLRWIDNGDVVAIGSDTHGRCGAYDSFIRAREVLGERWDVIMSRTNALLEEAAVTKSAEHVAPSI